MRAVHTCDTSVPLPILVLFLRFCHLIFFIPDVHRKYTYEDGYASGPTMVPAEFKEHAIFYPVTEHRFD